MDILPKNNTLQYAFVVFAALVSISFWTFHGLSDTAINILEAGTMLLFIVIVLWHSYVFNKTGLHFKAIVLLFTFLPFLSAIGAYIYHGQALKLSVTLLRSNFFWLFYFVLHIFEVPKQKAIKLMVFIGCVWAFLTIVQQFTYPNVYFYLRGGEDVGGEYSTEFRAGVYRFSLGGLQYGLFVLLFYLYQYFITKSNKKIHFLPFIALSVLGIYYYGTRQYYLGVLMCMALAVLYLKPGPRIRYMAIGIPTVLLAWGLKQVLFGQYIELTNQQMQYGYEQDIRVLCAKFFLFDYWPHWTATIIGNGPPHMLSEYGRENDLILAYFHFYRSDVGIIGTFNKFGILYIFTIIWSIAKVLGIKKLNYQDKYLRLFFFNALVLIILSESFSNQSGMVFFCFILYLLDKSIEEYKKESAVANENVFAAPELGYT